jgi:hypothetical protein
VSKTGGRRPGKFIGFFRLVDACERPGCPVCRCVVDDARQHLDSLLYEQVTDPDTRRRLRASWGFCGWHTAMLREVSDPAFGSAILYEDFLRVAIDRFEGRATHVPRSPRGLLGRWRRRTGRSRLVERYRRRAVCPGCALTTESEEHYVGLAVQFADDPQFDDAYVRSEGLCVPHALHALERAAGTAAARHLIMRTLPKWAELRRELQGFIDKHDYRAREPFTEAESTAHLRVLALMAGAPGLFGNDLRSGPGRARGRRG